MDCTTLPTFQEVSKKDNFLSEELMKVNFANFYLVAPCPHQIFFDSVTPLPDHRLTHDLICYLSYDLMIHYRILNFPFIKMSYFLISCVLGSTYICVL